MRGPKSFWLICILSLLVVQPAAADMQAMINAQAWDLKYDVTFKAAMDTTVSQEPGTKRYVITLDRSFSTSLPLDLRSGGPNISMTKLTAASGGGAPSAETQQKLMELIMRTEDLANWINGGPGTDANGEMDMQAFQSLGDATGKLLHTVEVTGKGLRDESNSLFDMHSLTTLKGEGKVKTATSLSFELDAKAGTYMLCLAHEFEDQTGNLATVESTEQITYAGSAPTETKGSGNQSLKFPQKITIDDPSALLGYVMLVTGTVKPEDKVITGESTIRAHYEEGPWTIPGTLHVKYTLTPR